MIGCVLYTKFKAIPFPGAKRIPSKYWDNRVLSGYSVYVVDLIRCQKLINEILSLKYLYAYNSAIKGMKQ